jgi:hypothetical protein
MSFADELGRCDDAGVTFTRFSGWDITQPQGGHFNIYKQGADEYYTRDKETAREVLSANVPAQESQDSSFYDQARISNFTQTTVVY